MPKLGILIADDHAVLRDGLTLLIDAQPDMAVVGHARSGREAVRMVPALRPNVLVLDVSMPDIGGAEAAEQICAECPGMRILALTRHADQGYLRRLLRAGAVGYVLKRTAADMLISAIRTVAAGGTYVDPTLAGPLVARALGTSDAASAPARNAADLTEREEQVLKLIAWGYSNKEAAAQLGISMKTVEFYKAAALGKLQLRTRTDILRHALAQKWLSDELDPE